MPPDRPWGHLRSGQVTPTPDLKRLKGYTYSQSYLRREPWGTMFAQGCCPLQWSWWRIIWESRPYLQFQMSECIKYGTSKVADGNSILAGLWVILFPLSHPHVSVEIRDLPKMLAGCGILCWTKFLALFRTQIWESCWVAICWLLQLHTPPPFHLLIVPDLSRCSVSWTNILLLCIFRYFWVCTNYSLNYVSCAPQSETFIMQHLEFGSAPSRGLVG